MPENPPTSVPKRPARTIADLAPGRERGAALLALAIRRRDADEPEAAAGPALAACRELLSAGRTIKAARALRVAVLALVLLDRPAEAVSRLEGGRKALEDAGAGPVTLAGVDVTQAEALRASGRTASARACLESARRAYAKAGHDELVPTLDHDLAIFKAESGEAEAAIADLVVARQQFLDARDREGVAACSHNIALLLHDVGQLDDAVEYFQEARSVFLAVGRDAEAAACDQNLGVVFHDMGRPEEAARRLLEARNRFARCRAPRSVGECDHNLSVVLTILGRPDEAAECLAKAEAAGVRAPADTGAQPVVPAPEPVVPVPRPTGTDQGREGAAVALEEVPQPQSA